jgi:hypothetical protein
LVIYSETEASSTIVARKQDPLFASPGSVILSGKAITDRNLILLHCLPPAPKVQLSLNDTVIDNPRIWISTSDAPKMTGEISSVKHLLGTLEQR